MLFSRKLSADVLHQTLQGDSRPSKSTTPSKRLFCAASGNPATSAARRKPDL